VLYAMKVSWRFSNGDVMFSRKRDSFFLLGDVTGEQLTSNSEVLRSERNDLRQRFMLISY
jgi:hypothetical protein